MSFEFWKDHWHFCTYSEDTCHLPLQLPPTFLPANALIHWFLPLSPIRIMGGVFEEKNTSTPNN